MRTPPALTYDEIDERMNHHPPKGPEAGDAHATARLIAKAALKALKDIVPPGREASLMATHAQEMLMWANAAIACNGGPRERVGLDEMAEIRDDFGIEYGTVVNVPTDGPTAGSPPSILRDAEDSVVDLAAGEVTRKN